MEVEGAMMHSNDGPETNDEAEVTYEVEGGWTSETTDAPLEGG